ncbi:MAG: uroporphyrinogen-III C-methyltransferase [Planctomycetota bacterium]
MTEVLTVTRSRNELRDRAHDLLRRDFPDLAITLGKSVQEILVGTADAVAGDPVELLAGCERPAAGSHEGISPCALDGFAFPRDAERCDSGACDGGACDSVAGGAALVFRRGDQRGEALRRFYLPPVVFAGAGPGGEGSLTLDVVRALERADIVFTDVLCGTEPMRWARKGAKCVLVGKRGDDPSSTPQGEINRRLLDEARWGRRVVRLKGGDPSLFARLDEETRVLRERGIPYRVLSGVSAGLAAAAFAGQSLTARDIASEVIFSTGRLQGGAPNPFPLAGRRPATLVIYMGRQGLAEKMQSLIDDGFEPATPVLLVEKLGTPEARTLAGAVAEIAARADEAGIGTPVVVLVGAQFRSPSHLPLFGTRIWLVAERETAAAQCQALEELGAVCAIEPLIEPYALPVDDEALFARPYDWVVFSSRKSVDFFFELLAARHLDARWLPRIAAMGDPAVAKLASRGIRLDLVPAEPKREALCHALVERGIAGQRILLPSSAVAPDTVRETLRRHAADVVRVDLYGLRFLCPASVPVAQAVLFSSESTVRSALENDLVRAIREANMVVGGIGTATCRLLSQVGLPPGIVPEGTSPASLARATRRHFARMELSALHD